MQILDRPSQPGNPDLRSMSRGQTCPVYCTSDYLAIWPNVPRTFLIHEDGSVLSHFQFISVLRPCFTKQGLSTGNFGVHSFWIGAASHAYEQGFSSHNTRTQGQLLKLKGRRFRTDEKKYIFIQHTVNLWNSLQQDVAMAVNLGDFKSGVDKFMED